MILKHRDAVHTIRWQDFSFAFQIGLALLLFALAACVEAKPLSPERQCLRVSTIVVAAFRMRNTNQLTLSEAQEMVATFPKARFLFKLMELIWGKPIPESIEDQNAQIESYRVSSYENCLKIFKERGHLPGDVEIDMERMKP